MPTTPPAPGSATHRRRKPVARTTPDDDAGRVLERPDGFHWTDESGRREFGPFPSFEQALDDMAGRDAHLDEDIEALHVAEPEIDVEAIHDREGDDPPEPGA